MWAQISKFWENALSSLWFVPAVMVVGAVVSSSVLLLLDRTIGREVGSLAPWLFGGTAGAARTLLSIVAGSLIAEEVLAVLKRQDDRW